MPERGASPAGPAPADERRALRWVLDTFLDTTPEDKKRRLSVLEGLAQAVSAQFDDDEGFPFDGIELDQHEWVSNALDAWRDNAPGALLPDQADLKRACRMLAELLVGRFQESRWDGMRAEYKLGRRGHHTRLLLSRGLLYDLRDLLGQDELKLPRRTRGAPRTQPASVPARALTSADLKAKLKSRGADIERFHVTSLEVFGSVARGEARPDSDVDFLVTLDRPTTAEDYFGLKFFLEELLGRRADLVVRAAVPPDRLARIEREAVHVA